MDELIFLGYEPVLPQLTHSKLELGLGIVEDSILWTLIRLTNRIRAIAMNHPGRLHKIRSST